MASLFPKFQPSRVTITRPDPMAEDEIAVKFTALGASVAGEETCRELRALIMGMEKEASVGRLMQLMTSGAAVGA